MSATGVITGTPTASATAIPIIVTVFDATKAAASFDYSLTINATLGIGTASLPNGQVGVGYSTTLSPTGGTAPYTWSAVSGMPPGLSINGAGKIAGTPTLAGTYNVAVTVTDAFTERDEDIQQRGRHRFRRHQRPCVARRPRRSELWADDDQCYRWNCSVYVDVDRGATWAVVELCDRSSFRHADNIGHLQRDHDSHRRRRVIRSGHLPGGHLDASVPDDELTLESAVLPDVHLVGDAGASRRR